MALKDNLISYWKLDEASGNALDAFGTNTLTETSGTIDAAAGIIAGGRDFEAGDTEYFTIASNASLQTGDIDFSFQAWVKLESKPAGFPFILGKWGGAGSREYALALDTTGDRFAWFVSSNGTLQSFTLANNLGSPALGTWYCLHCRHDSVNNVIAISVNAGTESTLSYSTGVIAGTSPFQLGQDPSSGGIGYWDGMIDEVAFWKKSLTSAERTQLYNGGAGLPFGMWDLGSQNTPPSFHRGPPDPRMPWFSVAKAAAFPVRAVPAPTPAQTAATATPPPAFGYGGPPIPGSPWFATSLITNRGTGVIVTPPDPGAVPPGGITRARAKPYINRVPTTKTEGVQDRLARLARIADQLSNMWNSLVRRGQLVQTVTPDSATGASGFVLRSAAHTATGDPDNNDDANSDFPVGCMWVNSTTAKAFLCVDNTAGAAVWAPLN